MYSALLTALLTHKRVAVFSHLRPDGDCLGAQVAMCLWLKKNGIETTAFNEDSAPPNLSWLTDIVPLEVPATEQLTGYDAFLVLDGNALHRFGSTAEGISSLGKPIYMIDHHPQPDDIYDEAISVTSSSSTCELVYGLYLEHDDTQIDEHVAKALYVGLVTDTGSFQFDSVTPATMKAAADLLKRGGFKPNEVIEKVYSTRPLKQLKLLSLTLDTIQLHSNQQIASICVTQAMLNKTGTTKEDTEGFVAYPLSVEGVKACVLFREDEDRIKLSLRSRSEINVNAWARELHGGGHEKAAGAWHSGPLEDAIRDVMDIGRRQLEQTDSV
ncbi:MAG: bifunctional oligoribonuclease/PAP phosphatase NrnA [Bacteroidota bacterium]